MKKKITIVIEVFNREITSVILLKKELEKRGYDVTIKRKSEDLSFSECDILIVPNGYKTSSYIDYRYRFNCKSGKVVNLQWEQLHTRYEEEHNLWLADGKAKDLIFLCWGNSRVEQLKNVGVEKKKIFKVGPIHTDTMRNSFQKMWKSRDEIAKKYDLDTKKRWILFISSMTYAPDNTPYISVQKELSAYMDFDERHILEKKTQKELVTWYDNFLKENEDYVVIYRPHPTEMKSNLLSDIINGNNERFRVINELDLKQWIKVSDVLVLWYTTSAIECRMTGKKCIIVRPYDIKYGEELIMYDGADMVKSYEQFADKVASDVYSFPIKPEMIDCYYDIQDTPSYIRIADVIEKVDIDDYYYKTENGFQFNRFKHLIRKHIPIKVLLKSIYCFLFSRFKFRIRNAKLRDRYFIDSWEKSIVERKRTEELDKQIVIG